MFPPKISVKMWHWCHLTNCLLLDRYFIKFSYGTITYSHIIWSIPGYNMNERIKRNNNTTSWGCWKHPFEIPGVRPMFLKPKLHKESKNGFKTINYRPPSVMFFSKNYFRHQKSLKKLDGFTYNQFPNNLFFSDIRST